MLLTTPVIRAIKVKFPNSKIDFLVKEQFADAVRFNKYLNDVILYETLPKDQLISNLRNAGYDFILDLHSSFRSLEIRKSLKIKFGKIKKPSLNKFLLVNLKWNRFKEVVPIPKLYANAFPNLILDEKGLELFIPEDIKPDLSRKDNYIGICPGSKHFTKMYPIEYFKKLINLLARNGNKIALFGGESDRALCSNLSELDGVLDLSNNNNLLQTAVNIAQCKLIISNDSGMMHTATAVKTPVVSVFGSTVKEFGFFPFQGKHLIIENNSLSCRPCSHIGKSKCPKKHFNCMMELKPELVFEKTMEFFSKL